MKDTSHSVPPSLVSHCQPVVHVGLLDGQGAPGAWTGFEGGVRSSSWTAKLGTENPLERWYPGWGWDQESAGWNQRCPRWAGRWTWRGSLRGQSTGPGAVWRGGSGSKAPPSLFSFCSQVPVKTDPPLGFITSQSRWTEQVLLPSHPQPLPSSFLSGSTSWLVLLACSAKQSPVGSTASVQSLVLFC